MKIGLEKKLKISNSGQLCIVFVPQGKTSQVSQIFPEVGARLKKSVKRKVFEGGFKEEVMYRDLTGVCENVCVVGVGPVNKLTRERIRQCGAHGAAQAQRVKAEKVSLVLDTLSFFRKDYEGIYQALFEGVLLTNYSFDNYKEKKKRISNFSIGFLGKGSSQWNAATKALKKAEILSDSVNFVREIGDLPGNILTPQEFAKRVTLKARGTGLKVTVWDKARIRKEKMGGLYGVSLGGGPDPRFIILEYKGGRASKKPVYYVGKGLTFDAGGISLKPPKAMDEMRYDMCGGAAVAGAMLAIAKLKKKTNAVGLIPCTENMLGPFANKPGDILRARNGKTVEVLNTDAEGRLILMDALSYASEKKPAVIFDAATLTGAVVVALGNTHTGVFTRDDALWSKIYKASTASGEKMWRMPLDDEHKKDMKGHYADIQNISSFYGAGSSTAAAFLENFVDKGIKWAHFDIAGTAWNVGNRLNYCPKKGGSGVLVRTFVELADKF